jgi:hypothetical protein
MLEFSYLYTRELIERRCKSGELDEALLSRAGWRVASDAAGREP